MKTLSIGISTENFILIILGMLLMATGIYRTSPLKFDKIFWIQITPLVLFLCIGLYFFVRRSTKPDLQLWGKASVDAGGRFLPLMILLAVVMALAGVLMKLYFKEVSASMVSYPSLSTVSAAGVAPTPTVMVKPIEMFWANSALIMLRPNFLWFLNAASIASLPLLMLRTVGFNNTEICFKMYLFGLIAAIASYFVRVPISWMATTIYDALATVGHLITS